MSEPSSVSTFALGSGFTIVRAWTVNNGNGTVSSVIQITWEIVNKSDPSTTAKWKLKTKRWLNGVIHYHTWFDIVVMTEESRNQVAAPNPEHLQHPGQAVKDVTACTPENLCIQLPFPNKDNYSHQLWELKMQQRAARSYLRIQLPYQNEDSYGHRIWKSGCCWWSNRPSTLTIWMSPVPDLHFGVVARQEHKNPRKGKPLSTL